MGSALKGQGCAGLRRLACSSRCAQPQLRAAAAAGATSVANAGAQRACADASDAKASATAAVVGGARAYTLVRAAREPLERTLLAHAQNAGVMNVQLGPRATDLGSPQGRPRSNRSADNPLSTGLIWQTRVRRVEEGLATLLDLCASSRRC